MKNLLYLCLLSFLGCKSMNYYPEKQITLDSGYNHDLDNNDNFSPDNQWLVYDTRTDIGGIAASAKVEKVNVNTGEKRVLYQIEDNQEFGPGVGAVSYSPIKNEIVFIHGMSNSSENNPYQQWRRTGVIVNENDIERPIFIDARDIDFPFTKGALRGGTHRHEFSGDGNWIGFTYNDALMQALEKSTGEKHNLRTIGVSKRGIKVKAGANTNGENIDGEWFSAVVVKVVPNPKPGSDEISHAAGDSWVGKNGYVKPNGIRQMARGFIGTVQDKNGNNVDEVFVLDIPENIETEGDCGPIAGTNENLPMPPRGVVQKRLTFTAKTNLPGCTGIVRSRSDGSLMAFLAKDSNGINQIFMISPNGGEVSQLTFQKTNVFGSFRWLPDGKSIIYTCQGSIQICSIGSDDFELRNKVISKPSKESPINLVVSPDGNTLAFNRIISFKGKTSKQIFVIKLKS